MVIKARYIVPLDGPVIENGFVEIRDGRVASVGSRDAPAKPDVDYEDAVIVPGMVNAHTHLELSDLKGRVPPKGDLIEWLNRLVERLGSDPLTEERASASVLRGLSESLRAGVTLVGDITTTPRWTRPVLAKTPLRAVSFGEVIAIGNRRDRLEQRLSAASESCESSGNVRIGISPHAPYTIEPDAMRACVARARSIDAPMSIHLAETKEEELFTRSASGPFADYLRGLGVFDDLIPSSGCSPVALAERTGLLGPRTVVAHANYVSNDDLNMLASTGSHVAYCPRTHRAFGHQPHRLADMLARGISVCIGTDSLASNPSLSILDELRFLNSTYPDLPTEILLAMGTINGARALGASQEVGTITPGKSADLVVIPLDQSASPQAWESIFESNAMPSAVYLDGQLFSERT